MKIVSLSFIVYIVLLLTQPCQDMVAMVDDAKGPEQRTQIRQTTTDHNEASDDCSPFCICSCCSLSVADRSLSTVVSRSLPDDLISTTPSEYEAPAEKTFQNSIWQPPKA